LRESGGSDDGGAADDVFPRIPQIPQITGICPRSADCAVCDRETQCSLSIVDASCESAKSADKQPLDAAVFHDTGVNAAHETKPVALCASRITDRCAICGPSAELCHRPGIPLPEHGRTQRSEEAKYPESTRLLQVDMPIDGFYFGRAARPV
jgi:hypothetical protein